MSPHKPCCIFCDLYQKGLVAPTPAVTLEQVEKLITGWVKVARNNERVFVSWMENGGMAMEIAALLRQPAATPECKCWRYEPDEDTRRADIMTGGDGEGWMVTQDCPIHRKSRCAEVLDIDTPGAQILERCELPQNHFGKHKSGDF